MHENEVLFYETLLWKIKNLNRLNLNESEAYLNLKLKHN